MAKTKHLKVPRNKMESNTAVQNQLKLMNSSHASKSNNEDGSKNEDKNVDCNWKKLAASFKKSTKPRPKNVKRNENVNEIWFDDVDDIYLDKPMKNKHSKSLVKPKSFQGQTKRIAIDCEMVGVGFNGTSSIVARVSIVNHFGNCIYDKHVKPTEKVTDYRTHVSGIRPEDIENGESFLVVQKEVSDIIKGKILVGHAISHDLKVLYLSHPRKRIRDTAKFKKFRKLFNGRTPSLKNLTDKLLSVKIQDGEHSSVQDAQAAMKLYIMHQKEWEAEISKRNNPSSEKK